MNVLVVHDGESAEAHGHERPLKRSRTSRTKGETLAHNTRQVLFLLRNMLPIARLQYVLTGASYMLQRNSLCEVLDTVMCDKSLRAHVVLLDGGLDRLTSETLFSWRESGKFAGVALATYGSPPSQPRFRGLRFQITVFYIGSYEDMSR